MLGHIVYFNYTYIGFFFYFLSMFPDLPSRSELLVDTHTRARMRILQASSIGMSIMSMCELQHTPLKPIK